MMEDLEGIPHEYQEIIIRMIEQEMEAHDLWSRT